MKKKTKKLLIYTTSIIVVFGIAALVAVTGNGNNGRSPVYSAGILSAAEENWDFGTLAMEDGNVSHNFEVKNDGAEPVQIKKVYTSCMCTVVSITDSSGKKYGDFGMPGHDRPSKTNIEVGPGESIVVEAVFDPAAHGPSGVGLAQRLIYLETDSAESPVLKLSFQAMVIR